MTMLAKLARTFLGSVEPPAAVPVARVVARAAAPASPAVADRPVDALEAGDEREAERFVPDVTSTVMTTASGRRVAARIVNVSATGVAVEAETRDLAAADVTMVGNRKVLPGRRIGLGLVFVFEKPIDARHCHRGVVL